MKELKLSHQQYALIYIINSCILRIMSAKSSTKIKVAIIPGNGCTPIKRCNWYHYLQSQLNKTGLFEAKLENMPDPHVARENVWIPFMRNELDCDEETIIIGHSSGAEAAMRFLESYRVKGCILVSACHTDLGIANERASGYYSRPWEWDKIAHNAQFFVQLGSQDDPFIPVSEQRYVARHLRASFAAVEAKEMAAEQKSGDGDSSKDSKTSNERKDSQGESDKKNRDSGSDDGDSNSDDGDDNIASRRFQYIEHTNRGHFMDRKFPDLVELVKDKVKALAPLQE